MSANSPDKDQPININISRATDTADKYNAFKEYLIVNNLELQNEVRDLTCDRRFYLLPEPEEIHSCH